MLTTTTTQPDRLCLAVEALTASYPPAEPAPGTAKNANPADAPERAVYDRVQVDEVGEAKLVASLTSSGLHAPALDVDMPAALTVTGDVTTLWVDGLTARGWRRMVQALAVAGLGGHSRPPRLAPSRKTRRATYATARQQTVDESIRMAVLRATGPSLSCSFAAAVELATATALPPGDVAGSPALTVGPGLANPWPVVLAVPAMLLPSTHNHHLYLQGELEWDDYRQLLLHLGTAGLLEPGYVRASLYRQSTYLRLPWIRKEPDGPPF